MIHDSLAFSRAAVPLTPPVKRPRGRNTLVARRRMTRWATKGTNKVMSGPAYEVIATVLPVVADSAAALAKTRAATPSSKEGEQGSPVRMECANASSSA
jgi:hypothetical protein